MQANVHNEKVAKAHHRTHPSDTLPQSRTCTRLAQTLTTPDQSQTVHLTTHHCCECMPSPPSTQPRSSRRQQAPSRGAVTTALMRASEELRLLRGQQGEVAAHVDDDPGEER